MWQGYEIKLKTVELESSLVENALEVQADDNLTISQELLAASWVALGEAL